MNRRQFMIGASSAAVAAALPSAGLSFQGVPIVPDPPITRDAVWLIESTPGYAGSFFKELYWWVGSDRPQTVKWSKVEPPWWPPKVTYHDAEPFEHPRGVIVQSRQQGKGLIVRGTIYREATKARGCTRPLDGPVCGTPDRYGWSCCGGNGSA